LVAALDVVMPVRLAVWPGDGLGTALHEVPLKCAMAVTGLPEPWSPTAHTSAGLFALMAWKLPDTGIGTTAQAVPLKWIVKLLNCPVAELRKVPTARPSAPDGRGGWSCCRRRHKRRSG